jgi:long-chain acyl-CoA synthetase
VTASGNVALLIDIEQSSETIISMIERSDTDMVIASKPISKLLSAITQPIVVWGDKSCGFNELLESGRKALSDNDSAFDQVVLDGDMTAAIAYTSGTTSFAKPVMLSHRALLTNASESVAMVAPTAAVFTPLPFYHTYGFTVPLGILIWGSHLGINGDLKTMMRDMLLFRGSTILAVPLIVERLHRGLIMELEKHGIKRPKLRRKPVEVKELVEIKRAAFGELEMIICGGAHLAGDIARELYAFGIVVMQGYGITECSPLVCVNRISAYDFDSVGLVLPSVEIKFVNDEILVRGPNVMQGYYKDELLTHAAFDGEWFKTGDIGYLDRKGFVHIIGRIKNLIVLKNGKKISPEEIESQLKRIPLIKEVLAYGAASGDYADDVKLALMIYPDPMMTENMTSYEILDAVQREVDKINETLPIYKQIQMINIREDEFSKTSSNKIKRQLV